MTTPNSVRSTQPMRLSTKKKAALISLVASCYLTACISLPDHVAAELEEPDGKQNNHYKPIEQSALEMSRKTR